MPTNFVRKKKVTIRSTVSFAIMPMANKQITIEFMFARSFELIALKLPSIVPVALQECLRRNFVMCVTKKTFSGRWLSQYKSKLLKAWIENQEERNGNKRVMKKKSTRWNCATSQTHETFHSEIRQHSSRRFPGALYPALPVRQQVEQDMPHRKQTKGGTTRGLHISIWLTTTSNLLLQL